MRHKHDKCAEILRSRGVKLRYPAEEMAVQLCQAAFNDDMDMIQRYVRNGADLSAGDYDGRTCMHLAASEGRMEIVKYLLDMVRRRSMFLWANDVRLRGNTSERSICVSACGIIVPYGLPSSLCPYYREAPPPTCPSFVVLRLVPCPVLAPDPPSPLMLLLSNLLAPSYRQMCCESLWPCTACTAGSMSCISHSRLVPIPG